MLIQMTIVSRGVLDDEPRKKLLHRHLRNAIKQQVNSSQTDQLPTSLRLSPLSSTWIPVFRQILLERETTSVDLNFGQCLYHFDLPKPIDLAADQKILTLAKT